MTASITWGGAMLVGVIAAFQLNFWQMNGHVFEIITRFLHETCGLSFIDIFETDGIEYLTFGRLMFARAFGGSLYLIGFLLLVVNIWMTARTGKSVNETREVFADPDMDKGPHDMGGCVPE